MHGGGGGGEEERRRLIERTGRGLVRVVALQPCESQPPAPARRHKHIPADAAGETVGLHAHQQHLLKVTDLRACGFFVLKGKKEGRKEGRKRSEMA